MSTVQSGVNVELTAITPELKGSNASQENKNSTAIKQLDTNKIDLEQKQSQPMNSNELLVAAAEDKKPLTSEQLDKVAQQLQDFVGEMNVGLEFSVDKESGRDVIKVIDKNTGDLVKQFPSEEVLTLVSKLSEMVGGFIDAKV